jgi:hypothetical protein
MQKKNLDLHGKIYDFDIKIQDVFNLRGMSAFIATDTVFINKVSYGELTGNVEMADLSAPVWWKLFANYKQNQLRIAGAWLTPKSSNPQTIDEIEVTVNPGQFENRVTAKKFPLEFLETIIPGISRTTGQIDGDVTLGGTFKRVAMRGELLINGRTQIDYLKSSFYIDHQRISLSEYRIWADGDTIWDASPQRLHMAKVKGGIYHDHFRKWDLRCSVESQDNGFMILNTQKRDNPLYYGQGIGRFKADFTGSFSRTNISIDAVTGKETRLYIPLTSATDINEVNFIKFKNTVKTPDSTANALKKSKNTDLKGLNFEMNLTMTDEAEVQMIFDEQAGDIIKGRGEGDIKLAINRAGEFKMYGSYAITKGEYLFTLLNFVNKPFSVKKGGSIIWYGDPYTAQIDLEATYQQNTSLYNLLRDEILTTNDSEAATEASKAVPAVVTMRLRGDLMKPNITFGLDFPNLTGKLKTLADSRLRQIQQDQNELARQVFGLVVVGSFLPSSSQFIQGSDYTASALNTLTQVLSNQLSGYLTGLASVWFDGSVSSIDFDIAYNEYQNEVINPNGNVNQTGRELQLRLTSGFANDRVMVQVGSQIGFGRPGTQVQDGFIGEDVSVEIQLTANRQWRLKVYQRSEPDLIGAQRRARYGFGLSFRKDYDSFQELLSGLGGWFSDKKKKG